MSTAHCVECWQQEPISFEPKLDYDNYSMWAYKTRIVLKSRGLWGLVEGVEAMPEGEAALRRWEMRDAAAQLQLLTNIPDKLVWIFGQANTVKETWASLLEHFQPYSMFKRSLATRRFNELKATEDGDIRAHVMRMAELWQHVLDSGAYTAGDDEANIMFVTTLLNSLPSSWAAFVKPWELALTESKMTGPVIIGHILDADAWNRGRAEAHRKQANGGRKPRSNKGV